MKKQLTLLVTLLLPVVTFAQGKLIRTGAELADKTCTTGITDAMIPSTLEIFPNLSTTSQLAKLFPAVSTPTTYGISLGINKYMETPAPALSTCVPLHTTTIPAASPRFRQVYNAASRVYRFADQAFENVKYDQDVKRLLLETLPDVVFPGKYAQTALRPQHIRFAEAYYKYLLEKENPYAYNWAEEREELNIGETLSAMLGLSFVGTKDVGTTILNAAKKAPRDREAIVDYVAIRALLNAREYQALEDLMAYRGEEQGWLVRPSKIAPAPNENKVGVIDVELAEKWSDLPIFQELEWFSRISREPLPITFPEGIRTNIEESWRDDIGIKETLEKDNSNLSEILNTSNSLLQAIGEELPLDDYMYRILGFKK